MNASTSSSISRVDMPGRTAARSRSMTSARMWPASRINAISRSDFSTIIGSRPHGGPDRTTGRLDRPPAGDGRHQAALTVVGEERRRLPLVDLEPVPHGRLAVILTLVELAAARVAHARCLRRRRDEVVGGLAP